MGDAEGGSETIKRVGSFVKEINITYVWFALCWLILSK